jgi:molybdopterin converting factor small subunit
MNSDEKKISVTVRSFIASSKSKVRFDLGQPFEFNLPYKSNVGELAQQILKENTNRLGIISINGKVVSEKAVLAHGDKVDLFALVSGG